MLYISICDDEEISRKEIAAIVSAYLSSHGIEHEISLYSNGTEFLNNYKKRAEELILLDIDMPGKTGIDIIHEFDKNGENRNVMLITGHDNLVLENLNSRPFQFIRKISMESDIPEALEKYLKKQQVAEGVLEIQKKGAIIHLKLSEIKYMEKYKNTLTIRQITGEEIEVRSNLKEYEQLLLNNGFVRAHTGYIVNLACCRAIRKYDMILKTGEVLPISRNRLQEVKAQFIESRRY